MTGETLRLAGAFGAAALMAGQVAAAPMTQIGPGEGEVDIVAWPGYIERGDTDIAVARFGRAVALDRDAAEAHDVRNRLHEAVARQRAAAIDRRIDAGDLAGAFGLYRSCVGELPGIAAARPWQQVAGRLCEALLDALRACTSIDEAQALARLARDAEDLPETDRQLRRRFPDEPYRQRFGFMAERLRRTRAALVGEPAPLTGRYLAAADLEAELAEVSDAEVDLADARAVELPQDQLQDRAIPYRHQGLRQDRGVGPQAHAETARQHDGPHMTYSSAR